MGNFVDVLERTTKRVLDQKTARLPRLPLDVTPVSPIISKIDTVNTLERVYKVEHERENRFILSPLKQMQKQKEAESIASTSTAGYVSISSLFIDFSTETELSQTSITAGSGTFKPCLPFTFSSGSGPSCLPGDTHPKHHPEPYSSEPLPDPPSVVFDQLRTYNLHDIKNQRDKTDWCTEFGLNVDIPSLVVTPLPGLESNPMPVPVISVPPRSKDMKSEKSAPFYFLKETLLEKSVVLFDAPNVYNDDKPELMKVKPRIQSNLQCELEKDDKNSELGSKASSKDGESGGEVDQLNSGEPFNVVDKHQKRNRKRNGEGGRTKFGSRNSYLLSRDSKTCPALRDMQQGDMLVDDKHPGMFPIPLVNFYCKTHFNAEPTYPGKSEQWNTIASGDARMVWFLSTLGLTDQRSSQHLFMFRRKTCWKNQQCFDAPNVYNDDKPELMKLKPRVQCNLQCELEKDDKNSESGSKSSFKDGESGGEVDQINSGEPSNVVDKHQKRNHKRNGEGGRTKFGSRNSYLLSRDSKTCPALRDMQQGDMLVDDKHPGMFPIPLVNFYCKTHFNAEPTYPGKSEQRNTIASGDAPMVWFLSTLGLTDQRSSQHLFMF